VPSGGITVRSSWPGTSEEEQREGALRVGVGVVLGTWARRRGAPWEQGARRREGEPWRMATGAGNGAEGAAMDKSGGQMGEECGCHTGWWRAIGGGSGPRLGCGRPWEGRMSLPGGGGGRGGGWRRLLLTVIVLLCKIYLFACFVFIIS
jgi:hypothetical protein